MSYELADNELWQWAEDATFGATTVTHNIMGPRGKVGFVRDIVVDVTTAVTWSSMSAPAEIQVGISSGDFTFGRYRLGTNTSTGYATGIHRASCEPWTGNTPRTLADFTGHVVLDGGPLTSSGIAGGSYGTVVPTGRVPTGPFLVSNVVLGTAASTDRYYLSNPSMIVANLIAGQKMLVQGVVGVNSTANGILAVAAVDTTAGAWMELSSQTFSGTYTSGGIINPLVFVTAKQGTGGSPAGGGIIRVKMQWIGAENP